MPTFDIGVAEKELEDLVERAKSGEEILIREGEDIFKIEPIKPGDPVLFE